MSVRVKNHKTGTTSSARIHMTGNVIERVRDYVQHLRPLLSPSQLVFPNTKGNEIDHLSRRVKDLAAKHKLQLPVATDSRHAAGTAASRQRCQNASNGSGKRERGEDMGGAYINNKVNLVCCNS